MHAARCLVEVQGEAPVDCRYRGRLGRGGERRAQALVVVGDRVRIEGAGSDAVVVEVLPRRNELARMASRGRGVTHVFAANVDHAVVVASVASPPLRTGFVDRCLAAARFNDIDPVIVLNKVDLVAGPARDRVEEVRDVYERAGFPCFLVSVTCGEGLDGLFDLVRDRTSSVLGQSGVGKTSLLNALIPDLDLRIGDVSTSSGKGMHTTTGSRLFRLPTGGFIVDTPGVRAFALETMEPVQIALAYPEFEPYATQCKFGACTHVHEPKCAVRDAVEAGEIVDWRYDTYVRIVRSSDET